MTYEPRLAVDDDPETAWRVAGDGQGDYLTLDFGRPVRLNRVGLIPGYAKIDSVDGTDRFTQNRRVLQVRYRFEQGTPVEQTFRQTPEIQYVAVDAITTRLTIEILATTPSGGRDFTPISEVEVFGGGI